MFIDENTKISKIINTIPESIEAIVSISRHFEKLKIPILRKTLASRVTIRQAAKIGGVTVECFYEKLAPLGFTFEKTNLLNHPELAINKKSRSEINLGNAVDLDVRLILKAGKDPFNDIMSALEKLPNDSVLNIINTFEPTPLINILSKKGFNHKTIIVGKQIVHTYFKKESSNSIETKKSSSEPEVDDLQDILNSFDSNIKEIDIRSLEMPLPMSTILNELNILPENYLLFVHHKKIPKFLFPELAERGYKWHIKEIKEDDVKLYIFK